VAAYLRLIARLKDGLTLQSAEARIDATGASNVQPGTLTGGMDDSRSGVFISPSPAMHNHGC
jgi:hypothetical protein